MYKYNNHVKRDKERRKLQSVLANPIVYLQQGNQVHKGHICCLGNKKRDVQISASMLSSAYHKNISTLSLHCGVRLSIINHRGCAELQKCLDVLSW